MGLFTIFVIAWFVAFAYLFVVDLLVYDLGKGMFTKTNVYQNGVVSLVGAGMIALIFYVFFTFS